jgi:hypothetical protein
MSRLTRVASTLFYLGNYIVRNRSNRSNKPNRSNRSGEQVSICRVRQEPLATWTPFTSRQKLVHWIDTLPHQETKSVML